MISTLGGGRGGGGGGGAARSFGVRFKEHIAITIASTVDHLRCSGYMHLGCQHRLDSCERRGHVPLEWPSNILSGSNAGYEHPAIYRDIL